MKRKQISKLLRFKILTRDNFTCRYCGNTANEKGLHVDHIIPVSKGGLNIEENLLTACIECNIGKGAKEVKDLLKSDSERIKKSINNQIKAFKKSKELIEIREKAFNDMVDYWCDLTGREYVDSSTIKTVFSYSEYLPIEKIYKWIDSASRKFRYSDTKMGKYISGCRRIEMEASND